MPSIACRGVCAKRRDNVASSWRLVYPSRREKQWRACHFTSREMSLKDRGFKSGRGSVAATALLICLTGVSVSACGSIGQTYQQGYVVDQDALKLVPVGSSREQVLLTLGTPSTTATFDQKTFYYIGQTRDKPMAFMKPHIVSRQVLAVYFDKDDNVERLANYSLKDGHVFDTVSRTTPTGGKEQTFLSQILSGGSQATPQIAPTQAPGTL